MLGFLFGTLCLVGLVGVVRGPRCGSFHHRGRHGGASCHRDGHHRAGRARGGRGFGRAAAEVFKRKLDLDEDQADLVDHALRDLGEAGRELRDTLKSQQAELARAFKDQQVDEAALAALFATQDEELVRFRRSAISALKQVHAVLEPDQREAATDWLAQAGGRWM